MKRLLQITLMAFTMTGLTTVALAQNDSDTIQSLATVEAQINVTGIQALDFGTLTAGSNSSVAVGDATAGQFTVAGNGGTVDLAFDMTNATLTGPGADIPITFGAGTAAWGADASSPTNTFDPSNTVGTTVNLYDDADGTLYVFVGGSITTAANQASGNYSGTIVLTATYN